jgi:hypothetical protein
MTEGRRVTRNGVPGKMVKVTTNERFVPDTYKDHGGKKRGYPGRG